MSKLAWFQALTVILLVVCHFACNAKVNTASATPQAVNGVVRDPTGKPLAGAEYWIINRYQGKGSVFNTGYHDFPKTASDGSFHCEYGPDDAVAIAFRHTDYAPTWLIRVNQQDGPQKVVMDKGIALNGQLTTQGQSSQPSDRTAPTTIALFTAGNGLSETVRQEVSADSNGAFMFHIPTEYWLYNYKLEYGNEKTQLRFSEGQPVETLYLPVTTMTN